MYMTMFITVPRRILLTMRNVSDKRCREKQNTHFTFNNVSPKICRLCNNVEKCYTAGQATEDNTIRRMRSTCWMTKVTDTLRTCNTLLFSFSNDFSKAPLRHVMRTLPVLLVCFSKVIFTAVQWQKWLKYCPPFNFLLSKTFRKFGSVFYLT
jgi:hypothetical protein